MTAKNSKQTGMLMRIGRGMRAGRWPAPEADPDVHADPDSEIDAGGRATRTDGSMGFGAVMQRRKVDASETEVS
jgi:hypothetical protein